MAWRVWRLLMTRWLGFSDNTALFEVTIFYRSVWTGREVISRRKWFRSSRSWIVRIDAGGINPARVEGALALCFGMHIPIHVIILADAEAVNYLVAPYAAVGCESESPLLVFAFRR